MWNLREWRIPYAIQRIPDPENPGGWLSPTPDTPIIWAQRICGPGILVDGDSQFIGPTQHGLVFGGGHLTTSIAANLHNSWDESHAAFDNIMDEIDFFLALVVLREKSTAKVWAPIELPNLVKPDTGYRPDEREGQDDGFRILWHRHDRLVFFGALWADPAAPNAMTNIAIDPLPRTRPSGTPPETIKAKVRIPEGYGLYLMNQAWLGTNLQTESIPMITVSWDIYFRYAVHAY